MKLCLIEPAIQAGLFAIFQALRRTFCRVHSRSFQMSKRLLALPEDTGRFKLIMSREEE
jgi:hypothetical protein